MKRTLSQVEYQGPQQAATQAQRKGAKQMWLSEMCVEASQLTAYVLDWKNMGEDIKPTRYNRCNIQVKSITQTRIESYAEQ